MTVEIFLGNPEALLVKLAAIIAAGPSVINQVVTTHQKGKYIILWT